MKAWIARDADGLLWLFAKEKPAKDLRRAMWTTPGICDLIDLDPDLFPEVRWGDDEPTEVELTIRPRKGMTTDAITYNRDTAHCQGYMEGRECPWRNGCVRYRLHCMATDGTRPLSPYIPYIKPRPFEAGGCPCMLSAARVHRSAPVEPTETGLAQPNWRKYPGERPDGSGEYLIYCQGGVGKMYLAVGAYRADMEVFIVETDFGRETGVDQWVVAWTELPQPPKFD